MTQSTAFKTEWDQLFIGGKWTAPATSDVIEVHSPATGELVGKVPLAAKADVDAACAAARTAFDEGPWPKMSPAERAAVLAEASRIMTERADELKFLLSAETGQPPTIVDMMQYGAAMSSFNYYAGAADKFQWSDIRDGIYGQTLVTREPVGVVAAVAAWNVPFFLAANKLGPALLAGCTIVLKPAAETPLSVFAMAEAFAEAGLPEGVLSVVPGGPDTGRALIANPEIDKYTFTGSSAVGKEIGKVAAERLKPCTLELGGKSAAIILEDADLNSTLPMLLFSGLMNTGQACVGQTRILAPRSRYDEVVEKVAAGVAAMQVGLPDNPAAMIGPLISEKQRERVDAKNGLENYAYSMKNTLNEPNLQGKLDAADKKAIEDAVEAAVQWLHSNQEAAKEEYEHKQKELEAQCNPIMQKIYSSMGGGAGGMPDMSGASAGGAGFGGAGFGGGASSAPAGGSGASSGPKVEEVD